MSSSPLVAMMMMMIMVSIVVLFQGDVAQGRTKVPYIVGGVGGWRPNYDYNNNWVKGKKFYVNDTLVFNYQDASRHGVCQTDKDGYQSCEGTNCQNSGSDQMTLVKGCQYFICSHRNPCLSGMKVKVCTTN